MNLLILFVFAIFTLSAASPVTRFGCASSTVFGPHYAPENCGDLNVLDKHQRLSHLTEKFRSRVQQNSDALLGSVSDVISEAFGVLQSDDRDGGFICTACKSVVETIQFGLASGQSDEQLMQLAGNLLCDYFGIISQSICTEYLHVIGPSVFYILNNTKLSPEVTCSFVLPQDCDVDTPAELNWVIDLPEKPTIPYQQRTAPKNAQAEKNVIKVLHLADTHVDDLFVEGTWDECDEPVCCRNPPANSSASLSGMFGGWKCDIPERTLDSMLDFVTKNITDIDHVFWTGDIPAHDLWGQSKQRNLELIQKTMDKVKAHFPGENIVLPSLGNHEPVPGNLLPTPSASETDETWSNKWLYDAISDHWTSAWLTDSSAETIKTGAYYKVEYRPGLYLVSINSVFCYSNNWWLILDSNDPGGELVWLVDTLADAEKSGHKVHIISHIPPGNYQCLKVWQRNYYRIIERFQDTVVGQFFGHTHNDEFQLTLNSADAKSTSHILFVGPSVTTYTYVNPGFRIYYIDGDHPETTRKVLDYETWVMDLEESNRQKRAIWYKLYSAKEAYGLESMEPEQWRNVYEKLKTNNTLLEQYHRYFWKDSPKRPECDDKWREEYLCGIVSCKQYGSPH